MIPLSHVIQPTLLLFIETEMHASDVSKSPRMPLSLDDKCLPQIKIIHRIGNQGH
jgi:hypothetical protein